MAVQHGLGHLRLGVGVLQPGQEAGLPQGDASGLERLQRCGRQGRQGGQAADLDLAIAKGPGDSLQAQARLQHAADGGDDVGDMDRHRRIGQDNRRGLARPIGLNEDLHRMVFVDDAAVAQNPKGQ